MKIKAAVLALTLLMAGCVGDTDKAPDGSATAKRVDPEKPRDTCQHTTIGAESRTICY